VASAVFNQTNGGQIPVSDNRIYGNWCFIECVTAAAYKTLAPTSPNKPLAKIKIKPSRNYWKIAGGILLGIAAYSLANSDEDSSSERVSILLEPPGQ